MHPRFAIQPRWPLAQGGEFGVGTFHGENEFFHLFESRKSDALALALFLAVADGVVSGQHDFGRYLDIMGQAQAPKKKRFGLF